MFSPSTCGSSLRTAGGTRHSVDHPSLWPCQGHGLVLFLHSGGARLVHDGLGLAPAEVSGMDIAMLGSGIACWLFRDIFVSFSRFFRVPQFG